jgi:hypothetical protein
MKTMKTKTVLLGCMLLTAGTAHASPEKWMGEGTLFNREGIRTGGYQMELINTELNSQETRSDVVVTTEEGEVLRYSQIRYKSGDGFKIVGDNGKGGGYCFTEGLCQIYLQKDPSTAYAITLVKDGEKRMRFMKTELKDGQAVRFFSEKFEKAQ